MANMARRPSDEATVRDELESFIKASGSDVSEQMSRVHGVMDLYFMHGQWACTNDQPDKAIRSFMTCLKLAPDAALVYCALGRIHLTRGDLVKADRHARRALELRPDDLKNLLVCHLIAAKLGRDPLHQERLALAIRSRIQGGAQTLGVSVPAWPWNRKNTTNAWRNEEIRAVSSGFRERKYTVLRDVLSPGWPELLLAEQKELLRAGAMRLKSDKYRYATVEAPMASVANYELAALVERILGQDVIPTYAFAIHYLAQGHIRPHVDRPQNELSMSLSLAVTPPDRNASVLRAGSADAMVRVDLGTNDALLYRGAEVVHARDPMPEGHTVDQTIFGFRTAHKSRCYCI